ncbi:MAG: hypothetical protein CM1200mP34_2080 [Verrucomicrobiales bacterium]|nr:MAG: hypothetical protein CM1200mP34_2080 [Verrucomicrobiales bacterium]
MNGQVPSSIAGVASGPWQIEFPPADDGLVTIAWVADHGVTDLAAEPNRLGQGGGITTSTPSKLWAGGDQRVSRGQPDGLKDEEGEAGDWIERATRGAPP